MATISGLPGISVGLGVDATGVATGIRQAERHLGQFAGTVQRSSASMRFAFQNVGFQISDMAVQISSGSGVLRAMTQQLPQLASGFGPVGVAVGTVAAVAGAAAGAIFGFGKAASAAADETKRFADSQAALAGLLDDSTQKINDQAAAISQLTGATRQLGLEGLHLQLQDANKKISTESATLQATLEELQNLLLQPAANEVQGRGPIVEALNEIEASIARGDADKFTGGISRLVREMGDPSLVEFTERLVKSGASIQNLRADASQLEKSIADVGKGGLVPTTAEMEKAAKSTTKLAAEVEKLTAQQKRLAEAGKFLLKTSAQEQRFDAAAEASATLRKRTDALMAEQARAQERMAESTQRMLEVPAREASQEAQQATAEAFRAAMAA